MNITIGQFDLKTKARVLREEQKKIEKAMETRQHAPKGTLDFGFHKLVKEKNFVKEELARVNSRLRPDPNSIA